MGQRLCAGDLLFDRADALLEAPQFFARVRRIAGDRPSLVKLHPNENAARSIPEVHATLPDARVLQHGNAHHMVANCDVLITQWSTLVFHGLALGKECYSSFDLDEMRALMPIQNGGTSAERIARVCEEVLAQSTYRPGDPGALKEAS